EPAREAHTAGQRQRNNKFPLLVGDGFDIVARLVATAPDIVHQDRYPPEIGLELIANRAYLLRRRRITDIGFEALPSLRGSTGHLLLIDRLDVDRGDVGARFPQRPADSRSDSFGRTSDDGK